MKLFARTSPTPLPYACRVNSKDGIGKLIYINGIPRRTKFCPVCEALKREHSCCLDTPEHRWKVMGHDNEEPCKRCGDWYAAKPGEELCPKCRKIGERKKPKTHECAEPGCGRMIVKDSTYCRSHSRIAVMARKKCG